jgi:hypothetical protein
MRGTVCVSIVLKVENVDLVPEGCVNSKMDGR